MNETQEFKIYLIGIPENDKQMLMRILKLRQSSGSARSYILTENGEPEYGKLYIVNSDDNKSLAYWAENFLNAEKIPMVPTIFTGQRTVKCKRAYNVNQPFRATETLNALDTLTVKEMDYIPELTIGNAQDDFESEGGVHSSHNLSHTFLEEIVNTQINSDCVLKAMVVDDSQPVRKQLEIQLKMLGVSVVLAENGEQAIELSKGSEYDIIFLDVVMPGIDGYKVCKFLKSNHRSKQTPVILLTGKSSPFDKVKGSLSGCDTYLTKPLQHEDFQSITRKYLPQVGVSQ